MNEPYVPPGEQLVVELLVRDLTRSRHFYESIGFRLLYEKEDFVALGWEENRIFLDHRPSAWGDGPEAIPPVVNIRVMVPDVDVWWNSATSVGARVVAPIQNRVYGLRDFTIADPDGFGIRFATRLPS